MGGAFPYEHGRVLKCHSNKTFRNPHQTRKMCCTKVELAAIIDAGKPFVQGTYKLESNGPVALQCYEIINSVTAAVEMAYYLQAIISSISRDPNVQQQLKSYAISCVKPALDYYNEHLNADLMSVQSSTSFSPHKLQEMKPDISILECLSTLPFLTTVAMKDEYPKYLAASEDVNAEYDPLDFWKNHESSLPDWAKYAQKGILILPSSASAERVFSILNNSSGSSIP